MILYGIYELLLIVAVVLNSVLTSNGENINIYEFSRNTSLVYPGKRLVGHVLEEFSTKRQVIHCAYECLKSSRCRSFNYEHEMHVCQLNDADHTDDIAGLVDEVNGTNSEYNLRDAYSIAQAALGMCSQDPCQNGGRCLDTVNHRFEKTYFCLCADGWSGENCTNKKNQIGWGEWTDWGLCSVSCGTGWTTRHRPCIDTVTSDVMSLGDCFGHDVEYQSCTLQSCPRWQQWSDWGSCSTENTCGRGVMHRFRNCSNGGLPGKDRFCLGFTNETAPCTGIDCKGMLVLDDSEVFGDGRTSIFNDITKQPMAVCADSDWSSLEVDMVCRQMGFEEGAGVKTFNASGQNQKTTAYRLLCSGIEPTIQACRREEVDDCLSLAGIECKVRGGWSLWTGWGECSVTCENGTRTRTRTCNHPPPNYGGTPCPGENIQYKPCQLPMCPINGMWLQWTDWGICNVSCEGGTQARMRVCQQPQHGGKECTGEHKQLQPCNTQLCPIDGVWGSWTDWTECTHTCGPDGTQFRNRTCFGPYYGGNNCTGTADETRSCSTEQCPIDGIWDPWSSWTECTHTCGPDGMQYRNRTCIGPFNGGENCTGLVEESNPCNTQMCPIDGVFGEWGNWTTCTKTCGNGTRTRSRTCYGPYYGGKNCTGPENDDVTCATYECPVDGVWELWSNWTECTHTCGPDGTQFRNRTCIGPFYGGANCSGDGEESRSCNTQMCPIDGVFGEWGNWTECTRTCGNGTRSRSRTCYGPYYGGRNCSGHAEEQSICANIECPVDGVWELWSNWTECTHTCGPDGTQFRNRTCIGPFYGGANCSGTGEESRSCNTDFCPIDGIFEQWSDWSECSQSCGNGVMFRNRTCYGPYYGGKPCDGAENQTEACNIGECLVPGVWFEWGPWSTCSVTCGGGHRTRERFCDIEAYGDLTTDCNGENVDTDKQCHTFPCTPLAIHCADWATRGLNQSCIADVDPDGEESQFGPVQVECDFDTEPGKAVTVLHHDKETSIRVKGFDLPGQFKVMLNYSTGWSEAIQIVEMSENCEQFMRWDCMAALIRSSMNGAPVLYTYWKNRNEQTMDYFGGAPPGSGSCACGETNTCSDSTVTCECDRNDVVWRYDEGFASYKDDLPIHSFYCGDTGSSYEEGNITVGALRCSGIP